MKGLGFVFQRNYFSVFLYAEKNLNQNLNLNLRKLKERNYDWLYRQCIRNTNTDSGGKETFSEYQEKKEKEKETPFQNHQFVDFYRDKSRNIGIIAFKNINEKKNSFNEFINELKDVINHVSEIFATEEEGEGEKETKNNKANYETKSKKKNKDEDEEKDTEKIINGSKDLDTNNKTYTSEMEGQREDETEGSFHRTGVSIIQNFRNKDNYLIKNIKNRIPYYDKKLKMVLITSTMENTFLKSVDFNSFLKNDDEMNVELSNTFRYLCNHLQNIPLITICNINGSCFNGGLDILLSTDFRIADKKSKFGFDKTYLGVFPYGGSVQKLIRHINLNQAKYLLMTNSIIDAKRALDMNLIDICFEHNHQNYLDNSCVSFREDLSYEEKWNIIKTNIIDYFGDIFQYKTLEEKKKDDSFLFSLFFCFQFIFIPHFVLQNMKISINEGLSLIDSNSYLDFDKAIFEKNINSANRVDVLNYFKKRKPPVTSTRSI